MWRARFCRSTGPANVLLYQFDRKFSHASQPEKNPPFKIARIDLKKIYRPSRWQKFQNSWTYGRIGTVYAYAVRNSLSIRRDIYIERDAGLNNLLEYVRAYMK
jgi:hypothetical protein